MRPSALVYAALCLAACRGNDPGPGSGDAGSMADQTVDETAVGDALVFDINIPASPCAWPHLRTIEVSAEDELSDALANAEPGDLIKLENGTYSGPFDVALPGTADHPIVVCGSRQATIAGKKSSDYTMRITADHW